MLTLGIEEVIDGHNMAALAWLRCSKRLLELGAQVLLAESSSLMGDTAVLLEKGRG